MTTFTDGPAAGVELLLRRAPIYLRVTRTTAGVGVWDALDQLADEPNEAETLFAYKLVRRRGTVHIDFTRGKGRNNSGWFVVAEYRVCTEQPEDGIMRTRERWRRWCETQREIDRDRRQPRESDDGIAKEEG